MAENRAFHEFIKQCDQNKIELTDLQKNQIQKFVNLLLKWNKAYNLIGKSTESEIYNRHILDCIQLSPYFQGDLKVLDVGAGAGFPSILLAIMTNAQVYACERIGKKCNFLNQARIDLQLQNKFTVLNEDVRAIDPNHHTFNIITARAFADTADILEMTKGLLTLNGHWVLLKGANFNNELIKIPNTFKVTTEIINSITKKEAKILKITPSST